MSDNVIAAEQPSASSAGGDGQAPTLQGTPAALATSASSTTASGTAQGGISDSGVTSAGMGGSTRVPTTSNALSAASSSTIATTSGPSSISATSGTTVTSLTLPAATSTLLAVSGASAPLTPMPAALLQLAAAAGESAATPLVTSTLQSASTVQYTPALGVLTRPVPRLGAGVLPAPSVAQVPASIYDIRRGETLVGMPDGLAHSVPHFSEEGLARLRALGSADAELLQANPLRPVNFSDAHVRLAAEREMLALVRCYGVESFAARVMNTTRLLQLATQLILVLEAQPTTQVDSRTLISMLRTECAGLVSALSKERDAHAATSQSLAEERSHSQQQASAATTLVDADALKSEVNKLKSVAGRLSSEKSDLQDQLLIVMNNFAELQRKHNATLRHVGDLEARLSSASAFSPDKLMDFIAGGVTLGGHWKRLHQLLRLYRDGSPIPPAFRTSIQVSARDEDTDDVSPYVLQADSRSSSRSAGSLSPASTTPKPVQPATPSSASSATPKSTISFRDKPVRQARRLSLTGSPSKGSPSRGAGADQPNPAPIDLTGSAPSTPRGTRLMRLSDRLKLQLRPSVLRQLKVRALKRSPDQVSLVCARRAVPAPFSWDKIRADIRELLLAGESFWDAVAEARKSHMLHDRFGKRALVDMLVSATYWQALDRTPWMNFVPEGYYHAAQEKLEDPAMTEVPELWEPLPIKPAPGSPDSSLSWLHSSDDDEDDDNFDQTYHGKSNVPSGSASAGSKSSASGKRPRGLSSAGKGSATKVAKTSTQSSAGSTSRPKAKLPAPLPDDGVIEPPKKGSLCHYGIKVQALNRQTMGFPSYMPVQPLLQHLHVRWVPIEYWELIQTCPWDDMWQQRISTLVFFKYSEMSPEMTEMITLILDFMSRWRREYWERYHWVTMDPDFDYYRTQELRAIPELADMYRDRKDRHSDFDNHRKKMMAEVEKSPGYSDRIWFEPGLWVVP
ncbi:hypothetical protein PF002_g14410 [Phytophthora fragariae]|uniref:Uncharacterized protein n=2 Tax=Phytophthora fragariae TaxID=53985 RepID=A0A6A3ENM5_9STRA|nr:hypothetical protein PF009_g14989 [Phytophthora fragariae]KAE9225425.1 hypothetical protein PF002_g14410 [Phytophthora fragariae]